MFIRLWNDCFDSTIFQIQPITLLIDISSLRQHGTNAVCASYRNKNTRSPFRLYPPCELEELILRCPLPASTKVHTLRDSTPPESVRLLRNSCTYHTAYTYIPISHQLHSERSSTRPGLQNILLRHALPENTNLVPPSLLCICSRTSAIFWPTYGPL